MGQVPGDPIPPSLERGSTHSCMVACGSLRQACLGARVPSSFLVRYRTPCTVVGRVAAPTGAFGSAWNSGAVTGRSRDCSESVDTGATSPNLNATGGCVNEPPPCRLPSTHSPS
eukprot:scaffold52144_cov33-Tisochrysis_lutea.AAC.5